MDPEEDQPKTKAQQDTEKQMAQGQEQSDALNQDDFYAGSGSQDTGSGASSGAAKGVAKLATSTNPVGKVASAALGLFNFLKQNKKASITGGSILGAIIGGAILILSVLPGLQVVWMGSILGDFNFGPHQRNTGGRIVRIIDRMSDIRGNDTRMGQQAEAIASDDTRLNRMENTSTQNYRRGVTRLFTRTHWQGKINNARSSGNRFDWRFFEGKPRNADGYRNPGRRMRGNDSTRLRASEDVPDEFRDAAENVQESDNPKRAKQSSIRNLTKGSAVQAALVVGCGSAIMDDIIPDEEERYEILMSRSANMQTAKSQISSGEDVHGDETADFMDEFYETKTILQAENEEALEDIDTDDLATRTNEDTGEEEFVIEGSPQASGLDEELSSVEEKHYSFSNSAAWKRNTRQEPQGNEIDIDMSFPGENSLFAQSVLTVGGGINFITAGAASTVCQFLMQSSVSIPMTIIEGAVTFVASLFTGSGAGIAKFGAFEALSYIIGLVIMNAAYDGLVPETPEELFGQIDMGSNLANSENARHQGAPPISDSEMNQQREDNFREYAREDRGRGFVWRHLSPENHRSTLSRTAMSNGPTNVLHPSNLLKPFTNFATTISSSFSRIFTPVRADGHLEGFDNYEVEQFSFNEEVINNIDPAANDQAMAETKDYTCNYKRIRMAGDEEELQELREEYGIRIEIDDDEERYGYYDLRGAGGGSCDIDKWYDASLMELLADTCMDLPYYELKEGGENPVTGDDLDEWEWGIREESTSPVIHLINCRNPDKVGIDNDPYQHRYRPNRDRFISQYDNDDRKDFWNHFGLWRFDSTIMDTVDCLTHDGPCQEPEGGSEDSDSSSSGGDGELMSHPNLGGPESNGYYRMPDAPSGEYTWNEGTPPSERCGSRKLVNLSYTMTAKYHEEYPDAPLVMGDLNAPFHLSHRHGVDVDIYGPEGYYTESEPMVSAERAIQLGKWLHDTGEVKIIFYNDPEVQQAVNEYAGNPNFMISQPGHWNHFHIRINDEYRGPWSEQC